MASRRVVSVALIIILLSSVSQVAIANSNGKFNSFFEFFFCFNSITNPLSKFLKTWRINEQEISLDSCFIDCNSALSVNLNDRNLSICCYSFEFGFACAILPSCDGLILNEVLIFNLGLELFFRNAVIGGASF